jgi:excinuclease ABC subunit C
MTQFEINIKTLPDSPGVYIMKNSRGEVIYVGKAKNLKKRVLQYFSRKKANIKTEHLVSKVADIETIVSQNELDAFLLENNLIKNYKPKYNISLKDDKTYPYIKITKLDGKGSDYFPSIIKTRVFDKNSGQYFGPYSNAKAVIDIIKIITKIFKIRTCSDSKFNLYAAKRKPCLYYQINRCLAPCCGCVAIKEYNEMLKDVRLLLIGKNRQLLNVLKKDLKKHAKELNFEAAIKIRDKINNISVISENQVAVLKNEKNIDVIGYYSENEETIFYLMIIRNGKMLDSKSYFFKNFYLEDKDILSAFLNQYYISKAGIEDIIPDQILLPFEIDSINKTALIEYFKISFRKNVRFYVFKEDSKNKDLMVMAMRNAKKNFFEKNASNAKERNILEELMNLLHLKKLPKTIECFDISNISGKYAVASKAVLKNGHKESSLYRKYKIKSKNTPDDYAMMYEALFRRFKNAVNGTDPMADLIMVDGGKGQLNILYEVKKEFAGLIDEKDMPGIIAIAKAKDINNGVDVDKIYLPNRKNEIKINFLNKKHLILLLMSLRDEAHRFAVAYHSALKRKGVVTSELFNIKGVGAAAYQNLINAFGDVNKVKQASIEELSSISGLSGKTAKLIYDYFHLQN